MRSTVNFSRSLKKVSCKVIFAVLLSFAALSLGAQNAFTVHKVAEGETFASIAARYNISAKALAEYNNLDYYDGALVSKTLRIPTKKQLPQTPKEEISNKEKASKIVEPKPAADTNKAKQPTVKIVEQKPAPSTPVTVERKKPVVIDTVAKPATQVAPKPVVTEAPAPPVQKEVVSKTDTSKKQQNVVKSSYRFPPLKKILPFVVFLTCSILLLVGAIFFYKSQQR